MFQFPQNKIISLSEITIGLLSYYYNHRPVAEYRKVTVSFTAPLACIVWGPRGTDGSRLHVVREPWLASE